MLADRLTRVHPRPPLGVALCGGCATGRMLVRARRSLRQKRRRAQHTVFAQWAEGAAAAVPVNKTLGGRPRATRSGRVEGCGSKVGARAPPAPPGTAGSWTCRCRWSPAGRTAARSSARSSSPARGPPLTRQARQAARAGGGPACFTLQGIATAPRPAGVPGRTEHDEAGEVARGV